MIQAMWHGVHKNLFLRPINLRYFQFNNVPSSFLSTTDWMRLLKSLHLFCIAMPWQTFDLYHAKDNKLVFDRFQVWMWCMVPLFLYAMERLIRGVRSFQKVEIIKVRLSNRDLQNHCVTTWALIGKTPMVYFAGKPYRYLSFAITWRMMKVHWKRYFLVKLLPNPNYLQS